MRSYRIGGLRVAVTGRRLGQALDRMPGMTPFVNTRLSRFDMWINEQENPEVPEAHEIYRFQLAEGRGTCTMLADKDGNLAYRFDSGSVLLHDRFRAGDVFLDWHGDLDELRYMLWLAYAHEALAYGAVPVHASAVVWQERAVLCLGESGTGKSTHTRLWVENIKNAFLLNDDSPIVRVEHDGVWAYGSPWSGKTPCFRKERYPVAAFLRLRQAPDNSIERVPTVQAFVALQPSCPPTLAHDEQCMDGMVDFIGGVIGQVPVFLLDCRPDIEAAQLSFKTIFPF